MPCSPICEREIACLAGWPLRVRDRLLPAALEPQMAHFTHLGETFMRVPECVGQLARGRARGRPIACVHMLALARKGARRRWIASSHPLPSGAPQAVYGATATCSSGVDVEIAADATAAAAPPHRTWPPMGAFGWGSRGVAFGAACACFGDSEARAGCVVRVLWMPRPVVSVSDRFVSVCAFRFACDCVFACRRIGARGAPLRVRGS